MPMMHAQHTVPANPCFEMGRCRRARWLGSHPPCLGSRPASPRTLQNSPWDRHPHGWRLQTAAQSSQPQAEASQARRLPPVQASQRSCSSLRWSRDKHLLCLSQGQKKHMGLCPTKSKARLGNVGRHIRRSSHLQRQPRLLPVQCMAAATGRRLQYPDTHGAATRGDLV
jgi:hypothetical protein